MYFKRVSITILVDFDKHSIKTLTRLSCLAQGQVLPAGSASIMHTKNTKAHVTLTYDL